MTSKIPVISFSASLITKIYLKCYTVKSAPFSHSNGPCQKLHQHHFNLYIKHINIFKSIFSSPVLLLCVHNLNNPSAHPSYSYHYLLSPSALFFAHLIVLHILLSCTFYFIAHLTLISLFLPYICSCVVLLLYNFYLYSFALSTERT